MSGRLKGVDPGHIVYDEAAWITQESIDFVNRVIANSKGRSIQMFKPKTAGACPTCKSDKTEAHADTYLADLESCRCLECHATWKRPHPHLQSNNK